MEKKLPDATAVTKSRIIGGFRGGEQRHTHISSVPSTRTVFVKSLPIALGM